MAKSSARPKPPSIFLPCLLLFGIPIGFCIWQGDYVVAGVLVAVAMGCLSGYRMGIVSTLSLTAGFAASAWLFPKMVVSLELQLTQWFGTAGLTNRIISLSIVFFVFITLIVFYTNIVVRMLLKNRPRIRGVNHWTGAIFGVLTSAAAALFFLGGLNVVEPMFPPLPEGEEAAPQHWAIDGTKKINAMTAQSYAGPLVEKYNPFTNYPQLNYFPFVHKAMAITQDPAALKQIINSPRFAALADQPELLEAIEKLKADATIGAILESNEPYDVLDYEVIFNSPAVLELLDSPGFIAEASAVVGESQE